MNTLYVTYCSANKKPIKEGTPKELYDSERIAYFIEVCESKGYNWAILSAKYGLFLPFEVHKNYNVTFKTVAYKCRIIENEVTLSSGESNRRLSQLIRQVRECILQENIKRVFFYYEEPLQRRKCYLHVLHAGVDCCRIEHNNCNELREHISTMLSGGTGKLQISTTLY